MLNPIEVKQVIQTQGILVESKADILNIIGTEDIQSK